MASTKEIKKMAAGYLFLLPNILGFLIFTTIPLAISLFMAFTDWNLEMHNVFQYETTVKSVGFDNFVKLFTDPDFFTYLGNTLFLMMGIPFGIAGSLGSALLLNNDFKGSRKLGIVILVTILMTVSCCMLVIAGMGAMAMTLLVCGLAGAIVIGGAAGGQTVYRTLFYFPSFTSGVATFILWKKLYSPENGPINNAIQPILNTLTPCIPMLSRLFVLTMAACILILLAAALIHRMRNWSAGKLTVRAFAVGGAMTLLPVLLIPFCAQAKFMLPVTVGAVLIVAGVTLEALRRNGWKSRGGTTQELFVLLLPDLIYTTVMFGMLALAGYALHKTTQQTAGLIGNLLFLGMALLFILTVIRRFRRWHQGECGTLSLIIGTVILCIPMLCVQMWSNLRLAGAAAICLVIAALIRLGRMLWKGRAFKAVYDYGMADAVILDGLALIGMFTLLGLSNVALDLPSEVAGGKVLLAPKWLSDYYWAKPSLMIMGFWGAIGSNNMLLYLAGLSGVSQELYEAADIDGASKFQRFWHVTWPQLSNVTFFILVMSIMGGLQGGFESARVMTQGGPAGATTTLAYYIYTEGFDTGRLGYASAVAWTLFAMVLSITVFNWKFGNKYTND